MIGAIGNFPKIGGFILGIAFRIETRPDGSPSPP
jgi:hypothetical protein